MRFEHPENFWFLLILIPLLLSVAYYVLWKKKAIHNAIDARLGERLLATHSSRAQMAKHLLIFLAVLLMIIASAQPQWGETNRPVKRSGIDIVFAIDLSLSMLAQDVTPNRLQAAKHEIESTLKALNGDRVGLVVFTSVSFQQSPLTADYGAIRFYLSKLQPHLMPRGGTSVGRAILDSVELLTNKKVGTEDLVAKTHRAKNQVIVLITDGEDHESDPSAAAEIAKENSIKIMSIGLGSKQGEKIPIVRKNGRIAGYKKDGKGELILTKLDEETLKKISKITDGNYIHYEGPNSISNAIVSYVDTLEKSEIESMLKARYKERFYFFLIPAFLFLLLAFILGERKKINTTTTTTTTTTTSLLLFFTLGFILVFTGCDRPLERRQTNIEKGNAEVKNKSFSKGLEYYQKAEKEIPSRPELHFNLGRAHLGMQSLDEARREYARTLETKDKALEFDALNNLGLILAEQQDWKNAHETFSEAMNIVAKSPTLITEKKAEETRWNLELAFRRLFPPCASLEDDHEEDDSVATSKEIETPTPQAPGIPGSTSTDEKEVKEYTLCGEDDDWFTIPAIPGTTVSVRAEFTDLREHPDLERAFLLAAEDIEISLFNTSGTQVGIRKIGAEETLKTEISDRKTIREITKFVVGPEMISSIDGEVPSVKLRIHANATLEFSYTLDIVSIPPCYALQEKSENNNDIKQAVQLQKGPNKLHICPKDEDWFWVDIEKDKSSLFVDVHGEKDQETETVPKFSVDIFDPQTEKIIAANIEEGGLVTAGLRELNSGRVAIRITGIDQKQQGPYTADLYQFAPCTDEWEEKVAAGDDRYEENDQVSSATLLDLKLPMHRYLRHCPEDADFYKIEFKEDEKDRSIKMGLALISFPKKSEIKPFRFDIMSASGDAVLFEGVPIAENALESEAAKKSPMPLHRALIIKEIEEQSAILNIDNGEDFYHLIQLNPQQDQKQDDQKQDKSKPENENEESENEKDKEEDDADKKDEKEPKEDEKDEGSPEKKKDPKPTDPKKEKEDPKLQRIQDLLKALEQTDDNFQLKKALENVQERYIEKDW